MASPRALPLLPALQRSPARLLLNPKYFMVFLIFKKLFEFSPSVLLCLFFRHSAAFFRPVPMG
ncbi:MAG: hypothetical protein KDD02_22995, partial [Phaeodactylibacter sp.]|nr:hypothetical protein [Phaeodactylibacter sp.]